MVEIRIECKTCIHRKANDLLNAGKVNDTGKVPCSSVLGCLLVHAKGQAVKVPQPQTCRECRWYHDKTESMGNLSRNWGECRRDPPRQPDGNSEFSFTMVTPGPACGGFEGKDQSTDVNDPCGRCRHCKQAGGDCDGPSGMRLCPHCLLPIDTGKAKSACKVGLDIGLDVVAAGKWNKAGTEAERLGEPMPSETPLKLVEPIVITVNEKWTYGTSTEERRLPEGMTREELYARILGTWAEPHSMKKLTVKCKRCGTELKVRDTEENLLTPEMSAIVDPCMKCCSKSKEPAHKEKGGLSIGCVRCGTPLEIVNPKHFFKSGMSAQVEPCPKCCNTCEPEVSDG